MKKTSAVFAAALIACFLGGCHAGTAVTQSAETIPASSHDAQPTSASIVEPTIAEPAVTWNNYAATGLSNVLRVSYAEKDEGVDWNSYISFDHPTESTIGVSADTMCPYCGEESFTIFLFSEIPQSQLGDPVIILADELMCLNWDNHEDSFYSDYTCSVMLTLKNSGPGASTGIESESTANPTESIIPDAAPDGSINRQEDIPADNNPPAEQPETVTPYLQKIERADQSIFSGPGYDYTYVGTVEVAGTYTIVEESWDTEGNLWGRLKSGVGWVNLSEVRDTEASKPPIAASFASDAILKRDHHEVIVDPSEYMVKLAFQAGEKLTDVSFTSLQFNGDSYDVAQTLYTLPELNPGTPFVAGVVYYGDMTTYGISFTDNSGTIRYFAVYISGQNGSLILDEYTP